VGGLFSRILVRLHSDGAKGDIYCCTEFISPAAVRSAMKREKGIKYGVRKESQEESLKRKELRRREEDELAVPKVFA
jgi:ribosome biogenesis protein BRX1